MKYKWTKFGCVSSWTDSNLAYCFTSLACNLSADSAFNQPTQQKAGKGVNRLDFVKFWQGVEMSGKKCMNAVSLT